MEQKSLFIAFTGPKIEQADAVCRIADGYECWNLSMLDCDGFIDAIQNRIPPVNTNVLNCYRRDPTGLREPFGISDEQYHSSSWGLLLPGDVPAAVVDGYPETLFLLNLYSPHFLYPLFFVTDLGIMRPDHGKRSEIYFHQQEQAQRFRREEFIRYHQALITEAGYGSWNAHRMTFWQSEDWRLFAACLLYAGLQEYENSKEFVTWPRESADMATILEALFTAGADDKSEVGYKLRKRAAALVASHQPGIEREIKTLYKERSSFVHGSFFQSLAKHVKVADQLGQLPLPPFADLYRQKECVRQALLAYLYLNKIRRSTAEFEGFATVIEILEEAIINLDLRENVRRHVGSILSLCAEPVGDAQTT